MPRNTRIFTMEVEDAERLLRRAKRKGHMGSALYNIIHNLEDKSAYKTIERGVLIRGSKKLQVSEGGTIDAKVSVRTNEELSSYSLTVDTGTFSEGSARLRYCKDDFRKGMRQTQIKSMIERDLSSSGQ